MATYDAAVGGSQDIVNNVVSQLFSALQPSGLFEQSIHVGEVNIDHVDVNITQTPTVTFQTLTKATLPTHLVEHYKTTVATHAGFAAVNPKNKSVLLSGLLDALPSITLTVSIPAITLTLNFQPTGGVTPPPITLQGAMTAAAVVSVDAASSSITVTLASGTVKTNDPTLDQIVNSSVVPFLLQTLNDKILGHIRIPTLSYSGLTISLPVPAIQDGFLVAYSALGTTQPPIPPPFDNWPKDGVFVSVDASLITAAGNTALSQISLPSGSFSEGPFTGDYNVNLGPISDTNVNSDGSLSTTVAANAGVNLTLHTPNWLPNFSFSAGAGGTVSASASTAVVGGELQVTFGGINNVSININFPGFPDWVEVIINGLLGPLEDFLVNQTIVPLINQFLNGHTFNVYSIPPITIPLGPGNGFNIKLDNVQTAELNPGGNALMVAHGLPTLSPA